MGTQKTGRKVGRHGRPSYGGDEAVDRDGISTENHMQMWARLAQGLRHGPPKEKQKKAH